MTTQSSAGVVDGGDGHSPVTAAAVAELAGGELHGDPSIVLRSIAPLDRAGPNDLSFLSHARYAAWYANTKAGVVIVGRDLANVAGTPLARVVVDKPTDVMVSLLRLFYRAEPRAVGVHPSAVIAPTAVLGAGVTVDAHAVIQDGVTIGDGCWIGANCVVGVGSTLGRDVRLHASSTCYPFVELGDRVMLHSGARVGREGFGFVPATSGVVRIPHAGRCVLEHDVEIGANSNVDRGSVDDTVIGAGTKIDSLVHVAHNVRIGRMCFIIAQVGIAGSTRLEDGVQIGGQAGIGGHLTIGARAQVGAQGGVFGDVPAGETWSGYPARPHKESLRASAALFRLTKIIRPLERLIARSEET